MTVQLLDAAYAPPRFISGQPWAGYLSSPTVYHPWTRAQLAGARDAGGLLPVYVAPLTGAGYDHRNAATDAASALAQLRAVGPVDRIVVALDTEARAYDSAPNRAVTYAMNFTAAVHRAGGVTVQYGPAIFLEHLAPHVTMGQAFAWLAWYTTATSWPRSLAAWSAGGRPTAWQYRNNLRAQGTTVDVSRIAPAFPLCRPRRPAPAPVPAPHPPATSTASAADLELAAAQTRWRHAKGL